jgi:CheY-like chemotaxis protein
MEDWQNRRPLGDSKLTQNILKPVKHQQLYTALSSAFSMPAPDNGNRDAQPLPGTIFQDEKQKVKILLAEDNRINKMVTLKLLANLGFRADAVDDGRQAVEAYLRSPYDLILMDCQMPVMDGYQASKEIRKLEAGNRKVRIIALTAYAMEGDRQKCLESGMDDYLPKPINIMALTRTISKIFKQK